MSEVSQTARCHGIQACFRGSSKWLYTYEALHVIALQYLKELVFVYHLTRPLRYESEALIAIPQTSGAKHDNRYFEKTAASP